MTFPLKIEKDKKPKQIKIPTIRTEITRASIIEVEPWWGSQQSFIRGSPTPYPFLHNFCHKKAALSYNLLLKNDLLRVPFSHT